MERDAKIFKEFLIAYSLWNRVVELTSQAGKLTKAQVKAGLWWTHMPESYLRYSFIYEDTPEKHDYWQDLEYKWQRYYIKNS